MQREYTPVRRNLPRLRKPGFSLLRQTIDADQVRVASADHFAGNRIGSGNGIQRLRFGALAYNKPASVTANFVINSLNVF
jgi:hypothetical protein